MLRAAGFLLLLAAVLALAWLIGGLPGDVTAQVGAYTIDTSAAACVFLLLLAVVVLVILFRVLGSVFGAPRHLLAWHGARRARLGEVATQRALVALAAGDAKAANTEAGRARKLLGETPLVLLLVAESARLAGKTAEAEAAFRQLSAHKEMGFLGHHGLLRASLEAQDHDTARSHAEAAETAYPGAASVRAHRRALLLRDKNYAAALGLTQDKAETAALATAAAQAAAAPALALGFAKQAVKAAPDFAPGVAELAKALRGNGKPRAAAKALLKAWRLAPHPLLAEAWLADTPTPLARAQAAQELAAANPGSVESELVLARTAHEAGLTGEAGRHDETVRSKGDPGARVWTCATCHVTAPGWSAVCPQCGAVATLALRAPGTALVPV
jgi:HemY protein